MLAAGWWAPVAAVAGAITLIAGALTVLAKTGRLAIGWWKPRPPLIAFGHPDESRMPFVGWLGGSNAEWERQMRRHEEFRLQHLTICYLIENKDTSAVRELSTGIRTRDGTTTVRHEPCFVQILGPGEKVEIDNLDPPAEFWQGMTDKNRAENFVYWARFRDDHGRRWEATYEPKPRQLSYRALRRERLVSRTPSPAERSDRRAECTARRRRRGRR